MRPLGTDGRRLGAVLALAAGVRLVLLTTRVAELDADEAVTGVMARGILDGRHRAFFAGQDYMGTPEQYLQAGVLAVLPDSSFVLRLPQVLLAVVAGWLVHRLAARCGLSPRRALLAAAMFAVGPYFPVFWSVKSRGAYATAMVVGLLGLVVALGTPRDDPRRWWKAFAFGVVAGVGFWTNQQAAYLLIPAAWWLAGSTRGRWMSTAAAAVPGFALGAAPALWHVATTDAPLFAGTEGDSALSARAAHFFSGALPDLLGARDEAAPLFAWLPPNLVTTIALAVLGVAVVHRWRGIGSIVVLRDTTRRPLDVLLLALLVAPVLFVSSGTATTSTSRFVFVLHGVLPVLLAAVPLPRRLRTGARPLALAGAVLVLLGLHTVVGSARLISQGDGAHKADRQEVWHDDVEEVAAALADAGAATAYADYWIAHPLNWAADGSVVVESSHTRRFPHISAEVLADPSPALVVGGTRIAAVRTALDARGAAYDDEQVAGWWIITGIEPGVHLPEAASVVEGIRAAP